MSFSVHVNTPSAAASGCDPGPIDAGSSSLLDFRSREVQIFLHYQRQSLEHCSRQLAQQETILRDYTTLRTRLATISDQARYPAVIPLGPHAVVRGELVHTNEILVFLGDNYFVERSSKQACEIASRRIFAVEKNLAKLTEERNLVQGKMDMLANLVLQQSLEDVVEIREELEESHVDSQRVAREKPATEKELLKRLDQIQDEETATVSAESQGSSIDVDVVEYEDFGPRRPPPPLTARPRRSSLPSLPIGLRKKERKSVTFAPFQGSVPERESKDHPMFKQALQMMLASGKFKSMDEGSLDSDEVSLPNYRALPADSALPRLKKQSHISDSMDVDMDPSDVIPMMDSDVIVERNIASAESPAAEGLPVLPDVSSLKPVSRFKASRQK